MSSQEGRAIVIYTDGSCAGNPGPCGGYAATLRQYDDGELTRKKVIKGCVVEDGITSPRLEMLAVAEALEAVRPGRSAPITVYSDNEMLSKAMNEWRFDWIARGWKTASGRAVANRDVWERIIAATEGKNVAFQWVKAHAGHEFNEEVDGLARAQMEKARRGVEGSRT